MPPRDEALLHLATDGATLLGVWIDRGGVLESYYPAGDDSIDRPYAEELMDGRNWPELVESLPRSSPYMAWWEPFNREPNESPESVFDRAKQSLSLD